MIIQLVCHRFSQTTILKSWILDFFFSLVSSLFKYKFKTGVFVFHFMVMILEKAQSTLASLIYEDTEDTGFGMGNWS